MEVQISAWKWVILKGNGAAHCKVYRDFLLWAVHKWLTRSRCRGWDADSGGPKEPTYHVSDGGSDLHGRDNFEGEWNLRRHSAVSCAKIAEQIEMPWLGRAEWSGGDAALCQLYKVYFRIELASGKWRKKKRQIYYRKTSCIGFLLFMLNLSDTI